MQRRTVPRGSIALFAIVVWLGAPSCRHEAPRAAPEPATPTTTVPDDGWRIETVADGVWAALQPAEGRFDDSNSLIVAGDGVALVVDSQASLARTRALIDRTRRLTPYPVRWLVNTHWHSDHTNGNSAWLDAFPGLTIVGHDTIRDDIAERAMPDHLERIARWDAAIEAAGERLGMRGVDREGATLGDADRARLAAEIDDARRKVAGMREVRAAPAALTLSATMTIRLGARAVELRAFRAHTRGDLIVLVPDAGVLASGDLLDDLPYGGHGYPTSWLATLNSIDALEFETIVPGHGPVFRGRDQLERVRALIRTALGGAALDDPAMLELEASFVGDDVVAQHNWSAFIPALIERVDAERNGTLD